MFGAATQLSVSRSVWRSANIRGPTSVRLALAAMTYKQAIHPLLNYQRIDSGQAFNPLQRRPLKQGIMKNIIVYLDDANYALQLLEPMLPAGRSAQPTRWIVVGCAPRVTQHVSKFVTYSARDSWRRKWSDKVFGEVVPALQQEGHEVVTLLAQGNLVAQTEALVETHGVARVLDARRPRSGQGIQPVTATQAQETHGVAGHAAALAAVGIKRCEERSA